MIDPNEAVKETEPVAVEQPQETEGQEAQVAAEENVQQEQDPAQGEAQSEDVDENGISYKNRYMASQRKLAELSDRLPKIIEETLVKHQKQQDTPQAQQYTIQQLEQIALQNPELRPQVEEEKEKIRQAQFLKIIEERDQKVVSAERHRNIVRESEMSVMNDPKYKECFNTDAMGKKIWNTAHPMTQLIGQYLQDPRLNGQPDAIIIASKLARIDYLDKVATKATTQAKVAQANLKREQKKTMVEGGGQTSRGSVDEFSKAKEELSRTGSNMAARSAVQAYLKKIGKIS